MLKTDDINPTVLLDNDNLLESRIRSEIGSQVDDVFFDIASRFGISSLISAGDITWDDVEDLSNVQHQLQDILLKILVRKAKKDV